MSLETDLHEMRPAFDRAMAAAAETVSVPTAPPRSASRWSRPRTAVLAFAVAACVAGAVGVVARINSSGRHGPVPPSTLAPTDSSSTSTSTTAPVSSTTAGVPLTSVQWDSVVYPIASQCGDLFHPAVLVRQVAYASPVPGVDLAVVMVRCNSGAGTPSVAVYVYDGATATDAPHLAGTLVRVSDGWQASAFSVDGATITLPVYGFSSATVPNCCPDVHASLNWSWSGSRYELVGSEPAHVPGPAIYGGY